MTLNFAPAGPRTAVLGATGVVGQEMLRILEQRHFPLKSLALLASARTAGSTCTVSGQSFSVELATPLAFNGVDLVLASAGEAISRELAPAAVQAGAVVVDNSNAFRMESDVPLVVPEVNAHDLVNHRGIIANPNCSTIQLVMVLDVLRRLAPLRRVVVATYQSVSGAGREGMEELTEQMRALVQGTDPEPSFFPRPIAANLLFHSTVMPNGYTDEEMKMANETRKILGLPDLPVTATCVRVPVFVGHSEAVNVEFEQPVAAAAAREALARAQGVRVMDEPSQQVYPQPTDAAGGDDVLVGRIRSDISHPCGLNLWVVADNLRKGAALNAVQIAEAVVGSRQWAEGSRM